MQKYIEQYNKIYENHLLSCESNKKIKKQEGFQIHQKYSSNYNKNKTKIFAGDSNAIMYWKYIYTMKETELFDFQEALLDQFFQVTIPQLYFQDWDYNSKDILDIYGFEKEYKFQLYKSGRKEGKTFIATLHAMAAVLAISPRKDSFSISLCSLSLENATDMLSKAYLNSEYINYDKSTIYINYKIKKMEIFFLNEIGKTIGKSIIKAKQSGSVSNHLSSCMYLLF